MTRKHFLATLAVALLAVTSWFLGRGVAQIPLPPEGMQIGKPVGFIWPAYMRSNGTIAPAHGTVRIYDYNGTAYVPTATTVPVDNPWPGYSFNTILPVMIEQINDRWVLVATVP